MEHLALEVFDRDGTGSKYAALADNTSITITVTSEIFAKGDVWSHSFTLNVAANLHIFGTSGETHGARLHEQIDKRRARLWVESVPLYLGYLRLGSEAEVDEDGNVDVTFESGQKTFDDLIEGAKANQVPMMSDVLIGMALWRKRKASAAVRLEAAPRLRFSGDTKDLLWLSKTSEVFYQTSPHSGTIGRDVPFSADGEEEGQSVQEYPRMVFPRLPEGSLEPLDGDGMTGVDCVNTDYAYDDAHPYCNVPLCYQKYGYERRDKDGHTTVDYSAEPEAQRGYEYMPANRLNSAPNFYVIYWLRALMKHLGIHIEENQMMDVEDLRRLFFVNTNCAYMEPKTLRTATGGGSYGRYRFSMQDRHIRNLVPEFFGIRELTNEFQGHGFYSYRRDQSVNAEESGFTCTDFKIEAGAEIPDDMPEIGSIDITISSVEPWDDTDVERYKRDNGYLHRAYASSDCFPNVEISEVIKALESGFGMRLLFSDDYKRVRIVLLRNIFRDTASQTIACDVVSRRKEENAIRGFRMTYGETDDTHYRYKGFQDLLPHKAEIWKDTSDDHDYSHWDLNASYANIIKKVSAFDKTCYVTPETGNAYGVKIDKEAKRYNELHPATFEYAAFMDAEDGDCTGEEETIETVSVGFKPAIMNDLNMNEERKYGAEAGQRFALFVDAKMRPRRPALKKDTDYDDPAADYPIYGKDGLYSDNDQAATYAMRGSDGIVKPGEFAIMSDMYARMDGYQLRTNLEVVGYFIRSVEIPVTMNIDGHLNEGYRLYLQDNFEPGDSGTSPIETHDWGLTLGIMRGSGSDAYVDYKADPDDKEGNDTWDMVAGTSVAAHPDTCDSYGTEWDYNGTQEGIGPEDRVSLKLRAEKPNPEYGKDGEPRYLEIDKESLRGRGLADKFYKDYSYWVRNARIASRTVRMELAQLLAIDTTRRVTVDDVNGFVRKMQYSVSNETGLGMVELEIMYI